MCDIATRLLAHIDSRNLCDDGEVKCDGLLRALSGMDRFEVTDLGQVITKNTDTMDPFRFTLELPKAARAFAVVFPEVTRRDSAFVPVQVPGPPIRELLEAAIESKEELLAIEAFEHDPVEFTNEMVLREARMKSPTEFVNSSYFFCSPWVGEAAADLLKSSEYVKGAGRKLQRPL
jgi:hypothetical protein